VRQAFKTQVAHLLQSALAHIGHFRHLRLKSSVGLNDWPRVGVGVSGKEDSTEGNSSISISLGMPFVALCRLLTGGWILFTSSEAVVLGALFFIGSDDVFVVMISSKYSLGGEGLLSSPYQPSSINIITSSRRWKYLER
jgi:hypothetical protein